MTEVVVVQKRNYSADARRRMSETHLNKPLTEEHKDKLSEASKKYWQDPENHRKHSELLGRPETRRKMSEAAIGRVPWNKGLKGVQVCSEETRQKMSSGKQAFWSDPKEREKQSERLKGKERSEESRRRYSESKLGENNPWFGKFGKNHPVYGKKQSEEQRRTHSEIMKEIWANPETRDNMHVFPVRSGEENPSWQGGKSFEPYCPKFNNPLKEQYRNAYGRACVNCGKPELFDCGRRLSVHHIDGNKLQGCEGHDWFLVPLCQSCNSGRFERKPEFVFLFWLKDIERRHNGGSRK